MLWAIVIFSEVLSVDLFHDFHKDYQQLVENFDRCQLMDIHRVDLALGRSNVIYKSWHAPVFTLQLYKLEMLISWLFSVSLYQLFSIQSALANPASGQPRRKDGMVVIPQHLLS